MAEEVNHLEDARESLNRVLSYDVDSMHRENDLGAAFSFRSAIAPTKRVIGIFKNVRGSTLHELPPNELDKIRTQADGIFQILQSVQDFDHTKPENTVEQRDAIVTNIENQHQKVFSVLMPIVSFLDIKGTDFADLETNARAAVQQARDEADAAKQQIENFAQQADQALRTIEATAAEMGVSQEALKFKEEADQHAKDADRWAKYTVYLSIAVGAYSVSSLFLHKWGVLAPANTYDAVQLALSKFLIFGVLTYMLFLSARNFLSHKHNAVLNRHRQSALVTFKALVDAGRIDETQDIVLTHAAECIYGNRDTGFLRANSQTGNSSPSILQMLPRSVGAAGSAAE